MATEAQILANWPNAQESDIPWTALMEKSTMNTGAPADYFMQNKANFKTEVYPPEAEQKSEYRRMDIRTTGNQDTAQLFLQLSRILYKSGLFYSKQSQFPKGQNGRKANNSSCL